MRLSYITLGCKLNFTESATISRQFTENGYALVPFGNEADVIIINTCTVTAQAERKSKFAVKKALKDSPNAKVLVIGCASQISAQKFISLSPRVIVVGTAQKFNVFDIVQNDEKNLYSCDINEVNDFDFAFSVNERTRSFLKIQDGCDYPCTYCTIPKTRGKSRNPSVDSVIEKAQIIAQRGQKEIVLTGVNIGDFGKTTNESFFDLVKRLDEVSGIERIRISSIEPNLLTSEIIDFVAGSKKFMPHFHIPLQSGSDDVLKLMRRRYNTNMFKNKILEIYSKIPDSFFGIDVIVGFPGETEQNFNETYLLLEQLPVSYLHVFPYSDRNGTIATQMKEKVHSELINKRVSELESLSQKKHEAFYKKFIGQNRKVLFESKNKFGKMFGYSDNYIKVAVDYNVNLINQISEVNLTFYDENLVIGKLIYTDTL